MIYLTKEWRINHEHTMIELYMRVHKSAEIIDEQEFRRLYTGIIETELHRAGELYEVHFLLRNIDSTGKEKIWYLTIAGTNVEIQTKK